MAEIDSGDWDLISDHLDHLLDLPEPERAAYLSTLMPDHVELAERLKGLLSIGRRDDFPGFLAELPTVVGEISVAQHLTGRLVGPYVIDGEIGRGGMGTVWRAHRADGRYEGSVAIKFLHTSLRLPQCLLLLPLPAPPAPHKYSGDFTITGNNAYRFTFFFLPKSTWSTGGAFGWSEGLLSLVVGSWPNAGIV